MKKSVKSLAVLLSAAMMLTSGGCANGGTASYGESLVSENLTSPGGDSTGEVNWITAEDISDMPETTIRYWYYETPERIQLGEEQIQKFMEKYPNIKVTGSVAPDNTDNEMLMTYIQSRTNSNIHQSLNIEDLWYVDHDLLYPLNNFPDFEEVMENFDPDLNYTWTDGNTYSISWYHSPYVFFYNKKILEEVGWDVNKLPETYSEFYELAEMVTNPEAKRWAIAPWMQDEWWRWESYVYPLYIAATGSGQLVSDDGQTVCFNTENGVKSLEFWETVFGNGWAQKEIWDMDPFFMEQTACTRGATENIKMAASDAPEGFEYVVGPIPIPDGNTRGEYDTYTFVRNLCIIDELGAEEGEERDRVRRASWEFLKFLLSEEQCAADFDVTADLPCYDNLLENEAFQAGFEKWGEDMTDTMEVGNHGTIGTINSSFACDIMDPLQKAYLKVAYDGMSAADAMAWAEEEANKILQEGR